ARAGRHRPRPRDREAHRAGPRRLARHLERARTRHDRPRLLSGSACAGRGAPPARAGQALAVDPRHLVVVHSSRGTVSRWRIDRPFTMKITISAMLVA